MMNQIIINTFGYTYDADDEFYKKKMTPNLLNIINITPPINEFNNFIRESQQENPNKPNTAKIFTLTHKLADKILENNFKL